MPRVAGDLYCLNHTKREEIQARRLRGNAKGGYSKALKTGQYAPLDIEPPRNVAEAETILARVVYETARGTLNPNVGRLLVTACRAFIEAHSVNELEKRIEKLEGAK